MLSTLADAQEVSSDTTIAQTDAPVKKSIRPTQESRDAVNKRRAGSPPRGDDASTTDIATTSSLEKEPDRKVRQEPLRTQEAAFPGSSEETGSKMEESIQKDARQPFTSSSDLNILDYYRLVNHDASFTKYFSDEVARRAGNKKESIPSSRRWGSNIKAAP